METVENRSLIFIKKTLRPTTQVRFCPIHSPSPEYPAASCRDERHGDPPKPAGAKAGYPLSATANSALIPRSLLRGASSEKKYKNAAKELVWQWFFSGKTLTLVPEEKELRRYHLHESHVQKAIRSAVRPSKRQKARSISDFLSTAIQCLKFQPSLA